MTLRSVLAAIRARPSPILASEPVELVLEFLFPSRVRRRAIPPLDGGLAPNDRLDECAVIAEVDAPDDLLLRPDGSLWVSSGRTIVRLSGAGFAERTTVATFAGDVTALAEGGDGSVLVGVAGVGVISVADDGSHAVRLDTAGGAPIRCPTAIAVAADGAIFVTDGSRVHPPADWVWSLMEDRRDGRLVRMSPRGAAEVVVDRLAWPAGVAIDPADGSLVLTQAWSHRVDRVDPSSGELRSLVSNLPGYPARASFPGDGTLWLAMFALRTHLVEFVLRSPDFKQEMMRTIHPDFWIRPDLRTIDSGLIPLQGGGIRKLGITKPWAPPRSYGMVCRLDGDGTPLSSLQSRAGGRNHGITAVRAAAGDLWMASKGAGRVLRHSAGGDA